ncbi:early endosome antigen 1-like [Mytilus californianus]|uniref:early endosome antigen 1-like n=1 Tax=Mytilus californianus TaxID=6549 RepID=UPI0022482B08|nr:early endosome antigen 1-like [Mytilus californianus]
MSLTVEESNLLRFYFLNLKVASKAARVYFDSIHPPAGLAGELTRSSVTLKGLRFMTKLQLNVLYPSSGQTVTSADFDTTLIVCLLRNLPPRESSPLTGWDNLPPPGDTSTGADLARVKWYRNLSAHSKDGILSSTDFNQFWGDLEGAIGRLSAKGGLPMLKEAQLAQSFSIGSLTDVLLELRNYEKSQQELTEMITNLQSAIDSLRTNKEEHEKRIHQVNVSHQKGEAETQKLTTEPSDYKDKCTEKLEACKNDIKKNEEMIKELQDQSVKKKDKIADLISQIGKLEKHDKMLKEHDEHLAMLDEQGSKQGEQIAQQGEQLAQHCEQMAHQSEQMAQQGEQMAHQSEQMAQQSEQMAQQSEQMARQGGSNQTRLEEDTKALIEEDVREGTFVSTKAVTDGLLLLKQNGVLLITGHAGTGKSRIGRHVLHMFCTENMSHKCMKLTLAEWDNMTNRKENMDNRAENLVLLLDDIFGETNCIYNREKDTPILDKVHAYVCKGNIKVIITIRDTVKRQCQEMFDSHRLFKSDFIDLSTDKYLLSRKEKNTFLAKYMKTVRQSDYTDNKGFLDFNGDTILDKKEVLKIIQENPVKGFPLVVYQFVHYNKYFKLESKFFDRPTKAMLEDMNAIRRKGEDQRNFMIQYAVMVYTAINENRINPDDSSNITEIPKIIDAIYEKTVKLKKWHISDAVNELKGSHLINIPNRRSYRLHHPTLQESVILSFAQIDEANINKIIPLISWSFFLKMVKPESYKEKEGEVVLRIQTNSFKLLADRLVDIYIAEFVTYDFDRFISNLCNTEIFQQEYCHLLPCLLEVLEKEDIKDKHTENMIRSGEIDRCDYSA